MTAIVLIGPMGAGKTSIGRKLGSRLGLGFTDTDAVIVRDHGPIDAIFRDAGEGRFREWEAQAVAASLADGGVVALGGGAVLHPGTRDLLRAHHVVLLTVDPGVVQSRIGHVGRPLLGSDDRAERWRSIAEERQPLYERLADLAIDTSSGPVSAVVESLADWSTTLDPAPTPRAKDSA